MCPFCCVQQVLRAFGREKIYVDKPLDVVESGAFDYYDIIPRETARDLGTIKRQLLSKSHFPSPRAFAEVRTSTCRCAAH